MKKSTKKLVLRSQTVRTLSDIELIAVAGGADSGDIYCPTTFAPAPELVPAANK
jgi:hypothetical protein